MAIPLGVSPWGGKITQTGIQLAAYPSTVHGVSIELQNSTSTTAASSKWGSVVLPPSTRGPLFFTYNLPLSTKRHYFRGRHIGGGYSNGSFTAQVSAKPVVIPQINQPIVINAAGNVEVPGANILISSGNSPRVGSQNSTSYLTKTIRFSANNFKATKDTFKFNSTSIGRFTVGSTNTSGIYDMILAVPKGVTVTKLSYTGIRRSTAGEVSKVTLYKVVTIATTAGTIVNATVLSTMTMTTGTAFLATIDSSAFAVGIGSSENFVARLSLKTKATATRPSAAWLDLTYRMPSYDRAY